MCKTHAKKENVSMIRDALQGSRQLLSMSDLMELTDLCRTTITKVLKVAVKEELATKVRRGRLFYYTWSHQGSVTKKRMFDDISWYCR